MRRGCLRAGRPAAADPARQVAIRLTSAQKAAVDAYATGHGITRTAAVRQALALLLGDAWTGLTREFKSKLKEEKSE